jgi:membrane protein YdbS with pleckstrin-like domain
MTIKNISNALNELSITIQTISLFSTTLIIAIGWFSVFFVIAVLYFYQTVQDIILYIFFIQMSLVIIHYLYMNHLSLRMRKRYDDLQSFVDKVIDKNI